MSLLASIESWLKKDEAWIANFLVQAKANWFVFEAEASNFWSWLSAHTLEISNDAQTATLLVNKLAAADPKLIPASVVDAVNKANGYVGQLTAAVNAANASKSSGGAVVDQAIAAYTAAKAAQSAVGSALAAAVAAAPEPAKIVNVSTGA